ncbi:Crp/Fnr family transcriptional regulator [Lottiidibacillus patelloidae]|uniref:Crp/Fnr family transcriptional regulator n=1 Tax=Lottiidibacillus patelloidae TaxID=2670334 RepID=A0A263BPV3_9BACI|nr:cyclic nucleotide-binding domain-containing protein [Lottiidibacillus patelloidae]OZM55780.1 Crp/Fnr family transcriptional regulator [Lottiidibacillus patelloidae]
MKEINNVELMNDYMQKYQLEAIFNREIIPFLSLYSFEQGEHICEQGDPSKYLYFLVKGKLKIYTSSAEGKTLILSFKTPLDVIGDIEYVQEIPIINTVEAVSETHMLGIPYDKLKKYANRHAPFLQFLLKAITQKFHMKSNSMNLNLMYPVEVRLASYLLSITYEEQVVQKEEQISTANVTDIANLIGTSYRHLNRVILKLCKDGLIERKDKAIVIQDREGLKSLVGNNIYE